MFTVLSNTRNSNLVLIGALAIAMITLLTLAVVPAVSAPQPAAAPLPRLSEAGSDYYLRHPEWASNLQNAAIPVTGNADMSDYFQRLRAQSAVSAAAPLAVSPETAPGMACESPVDCR